MSDSNLFGRWRRKRSFRFLSQRDCGCCGIPTPSIKLPDTWDDGTVWQLDRLCWQPERRSNTFLPWHCRFPSNPDTGDGTLVANWLEEKRGEVTRWREVGLFLIRWSGVEEKIFVQHKGVHLTVGAEPFFGSRQDHLWERVADGKHFETSRFQPSTLQPLWAFHHLLHSLAEPWLSGHIGQSTVQPIQDRRICG